ncbi:hypothetical protein [Leptolyngbya sp. 7M]|nr:hypothetical protein [Leptolyngbya sp. 7M]QYO68266.1 hypothetical protein JVX88_16765 [Leptolyngbya sp. 7M]
MKLFSIEEANEILPVLGRASWAAARSDLALTHSLLDPCKLPAVSLSGLQ